MPASEKTWRNQKTLHVVFGCTGLLLFVATIWMFGADHSRQWKQYQRKMRNVDVRLTDWRMQATRTQENKIKQLELEKAKTATLATAPDADTFEKFVTTLRDESEARSLRSKYESLTGLPEDATRDRIALRADILDQMRKLVARARFEENNLLSQRKFKSADYDEKRAVYDLGIRDEKSDEELAVLQEAVDKEREARDQLTLAYQEAAAYRGRLEDCIKSIDAPLTNLDKELSDLEAEYDRLSTTLKERQATYFTSSPPFLGKRILELPILDAFNSPLKINNLWTENLTQPNGSFGKVRRFDRCTTCHQAIDRTAPGSAVAPLYEEATVVTLHLDTPEEAPAAEVDEEGATVNEPTLRSVYGIELADEGLVDADDVSVRQVLPNSLAAMATVVDGADTAGLQVGDVLAYVGPDKVGSRKDADRFLLQAPDWGSPLTIKVVRGLPQPFSSHPRLDLFVGSLSPHTVSKFGCTICHEGQGSATDFRWVSHTPNSPEQQERWYREYGWFNNHHWIYPMNPARFAESSCLKCHHEVVELEMAAAQYDEPPAPKLMKGYHLIRQYGCFGCHEINGYNGPDTRIGPDMRLEPNYFAAAAQLKADPNFDDLDDQHKQWIEHLIQHPESSQTRHDLLTFLREDRSAEQPTLSGEAYEMISVLDDIESPGTFRKVGPSLRHVAEKVGPTWLYDWVRDPTHFRPSTRMPRFFGQWNHLDEGERATAQRYEPIEILGITRYLLAKSQPYETTAPSDDAFGDDDAQLERGKRLFETRGCLACHQHEEFPYAHATQGPELSNIGDKFSVDDTPDARQWMYTWLKNPSLYHPRTKMPNLYLEPITDADGNVTDPAADIAVFLLSSSTNWQPLEETTEYLTPDQEALNALVREHLQTKLYVDQVNEALDNNFISDEMALRLTGAEAKLVGELTEEKKLMYIGEKTISKYGCYACHDIPGFEGAKPIGAALADWGRKDPSKLAFEHIAEYVGHGHGHAAHGAEHQDAAEHHDADEASDTDSEVTEVSMEADVEIDETFYVDRLLEHDRAGFIWQKLKEPRSYDYGKARNKDSYNDRLRMPLFPFNDLEREAVVTFVLGLVAEPPADEFVYHPDDKMKSMIDGHKALTKFNCIGCHIIEPESWALEIPDEWFDEQPSDPSQSYPFMRPHFSSAEKEASAKPNPLRGTIATTLEGMPSIDGETGLQVILDEEGDPLEPDWEYDPNTLLFLFDLWKPTLIDGHPYQVGVTPIEIEAGWIKNKRETFGGDLTKWLLPRAVEIEKESNPQADGKQAYGWLPPPLIGQGAKVQTDWLHDFLIEPFPIRPAVFMRMPKFNMSSQEATDLVNYFAAKDNVEYPYAFSEATQKKRLDQLNSEYQAELEDVPDAEQPTGDSRFDHVMNIVTSSDYCVQCHMVGDFVPKTSERAMAPDLSAVYRRLRPDYLKRWLANPSQILPYTPMPVNVKYNEAAPNLGGVAQTLYHGTSIEQLNGLVDLLMNYPRYAESQTDVSSLVQSAAATTGEPAGDEADAGSGSEAADTTDDQ